MRYLTQAEVTDTVDLVGTRSAPGSRLVVNYQSPALSAAIGRLVARVMTAAARRPSPWAGAPRRSSWKSTEMRELLANQGFIVTSDADLSTLAEQLRLPILQRRSLRAGRIAVADRLGRSPLAPGRWACHVVSEQRGWRTG